MRLTVHDTIDRRPSTIFTVQSAPQYRLADRGPCQLYEFSDVGLGWHSLTIFLVYIAFSSVYRFLFHGSRLSPNVLPVFYERKEVVFHNCQTRWNFTSKRMSCQARWKYLHILSLIFETGGRFYWSPCDTIHLVINTSWKETCVCGDGIVCEENKLI